MRSDCHGVCCRCLGLRLSARGPSAGCPVLECPGFLLPKFAKPELSVPTLLKPELDVSCVWALAPKRQSPQFGLQSPLRWPEAAVNRPCRQLRDIFARALAPPASASPRSSNSGLIMSGGSSGAAAARAGTRTGTCGLRSVERLATPRGAAGAFLWVHPRRCR